MMRTAPERATAVETEGEPTRGQRIQRRRIALGLGSVTAFAEASGFNYDTLARVEKDTASERMVANVEAWLDRMEAGTPGEAVEEAGPIRLTLHGVYGVEEIIVEGPVDHPDELAEAVGKILERLRSQES